MFELITNGFIDCLTPVNLLTMVISVSLGIIVGALPGFGAATGLIIILPLTYSMEPGTAFVALTGVYVGAEYGGSISSILLNTPGTGGAVVTCFDGFPMARKGKARDALLISNIASFSGGIVSGLCLLLFMPILGNFVLRFGAGEIFLLAVLGLFLVGSVSKGDPLKGIASAALGVFMTCIGADAFIGNARFDFDIDILLGGLPFIPVMLGVFSVPHLLNMVLGKRSAGEAIAFEQAGLRDNVSAFARLFRQMMGNLKMLMLRSGIIGVIIGIIPGVGGAVATMVAYSSAKRASKTPEEFGKGAIEGIAAAESSNNGLVGGSLIPVLALGIPGSPAAAIFMGAIFMQGMTPGPNFMADQAPLVYLLIISIFLCAVIQLLLGVISIGSLANILRIPPSKLFPSVLVVCSIGAYVVRGLDFDIQLFALFGFLTYFLLPLGFNSGAFVLGMILGPITERSLLEALTIASAKGGLLFYFLSRPLAQVMLALMVVYGIYRLWAARKNNTGVAVSVQSREIPSLFSGARGADVISAVITFALVGWLWSLLGDLPKKTALFPAIVLSVLALSMGALLLKACFCKQVYAGHLLSPFAGLPMARITVMVLLWAVYLVVIPLTGFYMASFVLVAALCVLLSCWDGMALNTGLVLRNLLFAVVFTFAAYAIFKLGFGINTPVGM